MGIFLSRVPHCRKKWNKAKWSHNRNYCSEIFSALLKNAHPYSRTFFSPANETERSSFRGFGDSERALTHSVVEGSGEGFETASKRRDSCYSHCVSVIRTVLRHRLENRLWRYSHNSLGVWSFRLYNTHGNNYNLSLLCLYHYYNLFNIIITCFIIVPLLLV